MPIGREHKKESLELILLSVLADRPLYGYAITKQVAGKSAGSIRLTPGALYPLLHDLEGQKLIASSWEEVKSDRRVDEDEAEGRKRKWYRLTPKGRRRLEQRIRSHRARQALIDSFIPREFDSGLAQGGAG
jgi:DNA-binding PadR family transcriptional regulator